jgi:very-short-patch-repair endonuclease
MELSSNPEEVAISSHKKYWFKCLICPHDYDQTPANKTQGAGCPFCSGRKVCGSLECLICLHRTCYIYKYIWSPRNLLRPEQVSISNNNKFWFKCYACLHDYYKITSHIKQGSGCPYCANQQLCGSLDCNFCLFKSCYIYKYIWSIKNKKNPEEVSISNGKKYWFNCLVCKHDYHQSPGNKTNNYRGCPICVNRTEKMVIDFLKEFFIVFISQFRLNSNKRYDFCFPEYKLIIEIDGDQHFRQVSNWCCPEITLQNDIQKMKIAFENGYSVLRIYQPDIWNDNIDWRQAILNNMYLRTIPSVTYFSSNPEIYSRHSF